MCIARNIADSGPSQKDKDSRGAGSNRAFSKEHDLMIETRRLIKSVHTTEGLLTILKGIDLRVTEGEVVLSLIHI